MPGPLGCERSVSFPWIVKGSQAASPSQRTLRYAYRTGGTMPLVECGRGSVPLGGPRIRLTLIGRHLDVPALAAAAAPAVSRHRVGVPCAVSVLLGVVVIVLVRNAMPSPRYMMDAVRGDSAWWVVDPARWADVRREVRPPLVRDLAADGIPVAVTCRVLGFRRYRQLCARRRLRSRLAVGSDKAHA